MKPSTKILDELGNDPLRRDVPQAGYQGQPGSFGARAAVRCGRPVSYPTFGKLLGALLAGEVDCALLPVQNKVVGPVVEPLEALWAALAETTTALAVTEEIPVPVRLVLAAPRGTALEDVKEVLSQSPALRQCRKLVAELGAEAIETPDTAWAAADVAERGGNRAAVCSEEAALEAGLVVLLEDVSDVKPNSTRFLRLQLLSSQRAVPVADPECGPAVPRPVPRVVRYAGPKLQALLHDAGAELLSLPGTAEAPVRGFALVPEAKTTVVATRVNGAAKDLLWIGETPRAVPEPRLKDAPQVTAQIPLTRVAIGPFAVGAGARAVIAGPCAVESPEQILRLAKAVSRAGATALRGGVYKPRTSPHAFQGHGLEGLAWLRAAGDAVGLPIVTEVMAPSQVGKLAEKAEILQIGARNCQNYDLLKEAGGSGRAILLKRGFGTTVDEWLSAAEYLFAAGARDVMLMERGIRTFERSTRSTLDLCGLVAARGLTHLPLLVDPSHAAGRRDLVPQLSRAAWAAGADGLMIEVHDMPETALSDGPQALLPEDLEDLCDSFGLVPRESDSVERIRRAIDTVDAGISKLVTQRLELCRLVAEVKRAQGRPLRDAAREERVKARFAAALDDVAGERLGEALIALGLEAEGWSGEEARG
ncbi:MAG: 3-deoxy-7-phosphoheptulonate synthase [Acidobacteria bacterium]|nr:3-deoxy-7-phosphoheptulonate synthase [Acidobacteriota bacterium]